MPYQFLNNGARVWFRSDRRAEPAIDTASHCGAVEPVHNCPCLRCIQLAAATVIDRNGQRD